MKISNLLRFVAASLIALTFAPTIAQAADIPLLTWQRGREQQVVIAEGSLNRQWSVTLEGNGIPELSFQGSSKDARGYVVFSIAIPDDLAVGAYSVYAQEAGKEKTLIAGVNITLAQTRTAGSSLIDLTWIVLIFVVLTSIVSTIRARKYLYIPFASTQVLPRITDPIVDEEENFWDRLETAPYRMRITWLNAFKPSLLRFLFIREGELSHRLNKNLYGVTPFLGFIGGAAVAIQVEKNGGLALTATMLLLVIAVIGIFDAFAGIAVTLGFWSLQIFSGNVTSIRDILISLALGISWIGPSLFAALLRETIGRDFAPQNSRAGEPIRVAGIIGSSAIGALVFYFGQLLLQSIIYVERPQLEVTWTHALIIAVVLAVRGFADYVILSKTTDSGLRDESFFMARVTSPATSLFVGLVILSFTYIWTTSASKAFFVAILFTLPYIFSFIRFAKNDRIKVENISRNILLEAALLAVITFIIFRQISVSPLLLEKRVELLLLLVGLAPALHAVFSAIYSSNEEKFSFDENSEIMKP